MGRDRCGRVREEGKPESRLNLEVSSARGHASEGRKQAAGESSLVSDLPGNRHWGVRIE